MKGLITVKIVVFGLLKRAVWARGDVNQAESFFANAKEFQSKVQIFASNAQVRVRNVRKRLKIFENVRKLSENIQKLGGNIRKYSNFFYPPAQMIDLAPLTAGDFSGGKNQSKIRSTKSYPPTINLRRTLREFKISSTLTDWGIWG